MDKSLRLDCTANVNLKFNYKVVKYLHCQDLNTNPAYLTENRNHSSDFTHFSSVSKISASWVQICSMGFLVENNWSREQMDMGMGWTRTLISGNISPTLKYSHAIIRVKSLRKKNLSRGPPSSGKKSEEDAPAEL